MLTFFLFSVSLRLCFYALISDAVRLILKSEISLIVVVAYSGASFENLALKLLYFQNFIPLGFLNIFGDHSLTDLLIKQRNVPLRYCMSKAIVAKPQDAGLFRFEPWILVILSILSVSKLRVFCHLPQLNLSLH